MAIGVVPALKVAGTVAAIGVGAVGVGWAAGEISNIVTQVVTGILLIFVQILGTVFLMVVDLMISVVTIEDLFGVVAHQLEIMWLLLRDISNLVFILVFMVMVFSTILQRGNYRWNVLFPKLVFAAVMINFSKTITLFLVDISQVFMITFSRRLADLGAGNLTSALGIEKMLDTGDLSTTRGNLTIIGSLFLGLFMLLNSIFVILIVSVILFIRLVGLWVLLALSPVPWIADLVPFLKQHANMWWSTLTKYLVSGPVLTFMLWFTFTFAALASHNNGNSLVNISTTAQDATLVTGEYFETPLSSLEMIINFVIIMVLLWTTLIVAQKSGVAGAGKVVKHGRSINTWSRNLLGNSIIRAPGWSVRGSHYLYKNAGRIRDGAIDSVKKGGGAIANWGREFGRNDNGDLDGGVIGKAILSGSWDTIKRGGKGLKSLDENIIQDLYVEQVGPKTKESFKRIMNKRTRQQKRKTSNLFDRVFRSSTLVQQVEMNYQEEVKDMLEEKDWLKNIGPEDAASQVGALLLKYQGDDKKISGLDRTKLIFFARKLQDKKKLGAVTGHLKKQASEGNSSAKEMLKDAAAIDNKGQAVELLYNAITKGSSGENLQADLSLMQTIDPSKVSQDMNTGEMTERSAKDLAEDAVGSLSSSSPTQLLSGLNGNNELALAKFSEILPRVKDKHLENLTADAAESLRYFIEAFEGKGKEDIIDAVKDNLKSNSRTDGTLSENFDLLEYGEGDILFDRTISNFNKLGSSDMESRLDTIARAVGGGGASASARFSTGYTANTGHTADTSRTAETDRTAETSRTADIDRAIADKAKADRARDDSVRADRVRINRSSTGISDSVIAARVKDGRDRDARVSANRVKDAIARDKRRQESPPNQYTSSDSPRKAQSSAESAPGDLSAGISLNNLTKGIKESLELGFANVSAHFTGVDGQDSETREFFAELLGVADDQLEAVQGLNISLAKLNEGPSDQLAKLAEILTQQSLKMSAAKVVDLRRYREQKGYQGKELSELKKLVNESTEPTEEREKLQQLVTYLEKEDEVKKNLNSLKKEGGQLHLINKNNPQKYRQAKDTLIHEQFHTWFANNTEALSGLKKVLTANSDDPKIKASLAKIGEHWPSNESGAAKDSHHQEEVLIEALVHLFSQKTGQKVAAGESSKTIETSVASEFQLGQVEQLSGLLSEVLEQFKADRAADKQKKAAGQAKAKKDSSSSRSSSQSAPTDKTPKSKSS